MARIASTIIVVFFSGGLNKFPMKASLCTVFFALRSEMRSHLRHALHEALTAPSGRAHLVVAVVIVVVFQELLRTSNERRLQNYAIMGYY